MTARVTALEEVYQELRRSYRTQRFIESQAAILEAGEDNNGDLESVPVSEYVTALILPLSSNKGTEKAEEDDDEDKEGDKEEEPEDG